MLGDKDEGPLPRKYREKTQKLVQPGWAFRGPHHSLLALPKAQGEILLKSFEPLSFDNL